METGDIIMEYYFAGELSENQCSLMRDSLAECWIKIDEQPAAPDLLSYIMLLIKKHSTMGTIKNELKDLDVDDAKSKLFATMIGAKLQEISTINVQPFQQQPVVVESKVISLLPSMSTAEASAHPGGIMGPLKASRGGVQASSNIFPSDAKTASSRLLHSALQSTREVKNKSENSVRDGLSVPRDSRDSIMKANHSNNRGAAKNNNKRGHQTEVVFDEASSSSKIPKHVKQQQYHVDNSSAGIGSVGSEQTTVGTVEYFEKMNKVAMLSGFKNAQEMLASQKEMLMLMQKSQAPAQQQIPSTVQTEASMANEQQQQHPFSSHSLSTSWGGGGRWTDGRTGRGRSFGRANQSAFYAGDATESAGAMQRGWWSDGGRWANGRAGRGGRAFVVPSTQQTQVEATADDNEGALSTQKGVGVAAAVASLPNTTRDVSEAPAVNKSESDQDGVAVSVGSYSGEFDPSTYYAPYGGRFGGLGRGGGRSSWRGGRIGHAGRGYGRMASYASATAAVGNKTWVRPADIDNSLANSR